MTASRYGVLLRRRSVKCAGANLILLDANNFYVSVHRVFEPQLIDKPVVVLSNQDGCVVARSNEVKALGIPMGQPWFQLKHLAEQHSIIPRSSNYPLYGDLSARLMSILRQGLGSIEVYSIDEAWSLPTARDPAATAREIREKVRAWIGLPISVGIAPTKGLAKLANKLAKKNPEYDGVCDLGSFSAATLSSVLDDTPVEDLWGIAAGLGQRLAALGITTAGALRAANPAMLRLHGGIVLERICLELRGQSCLPLELVQAPRKQLMCSRSLGAELRHLVDLREPVTVFTCKVAEKLRRANLRAGGLSLFIQTNPFKKGAIPYCGARSVVFPLGTDDSVEMVRAAQSLLLKIFIPGLAYKRVGVMLWGLEAPRQLTLDLPEQSNERSRNLMRTLDAVNVRFGRGSLRLASAGTRPAWEGTQRYLSPAFTTRWKDIPTATA